MSSESFQMFLAKLENDAGMRQELRATGFDSGMPPDAVIAFAARKGYVFTIEDVGELTDQQLDAVAGGGEDSIAKDSIGELGESQSLRLQMAMDRQSKAMSIISNIMKKMSDTLGGISGNFK